MPVAAITLPQRSISRFTYSVNSADDEPTAMMPWAASFSLTSAECSASIAVALKLGQNRLRRRGRHDQAIPVVGLDLRHAELGGGCHRRQERDARAAADRQRAQLARLDAAEQNRNVRKQHLDMVAKEVVHGGRRAGIGRVDQLDVGRELEQLHGHVRHAAEPGRCEDQLAGLRLRQRDQLGQRRRPALSR